MKSCHRKLLLHRWIPRASMIMNAYSAFGPHREMPSREFTRILYGCERCEAVRVRDIDGHWTQEDLRIHAAK